MRPSFSPWPFLNSEFSSTIEQFTLGPFAWFSCSLAEVRTVADCRAFAMALSQQMYHSELRNALNLSIGCRKPFILACFRLLPSQKNNVMQVLHEWTNWRTFYSTFNCNFSTLQLLSAWTLPTVFVYQRVNSSDVDVFVWIIPWAGPLGRLLFGSDSGSHFFGQSSGWVGFKTKHRFKTKHWKLPQIWDF